MSNTKNTKVGFIGMGWVGDSTAQDFIARGFRPICYSMEPKYSANKNKIKDCDFVFIAVPTPTTPKGFDDSILRNVMKLVGKGKVAVIKSTVLPGVTNSIQDQNPDIFVMHSPEFLSEVSALEDSAHPKRNIIGIPKDIPAFRQKAEELMTLLPKAPYNTIVSATEAEIIKYARNGAGYFRVIFYNLLYDVAMEKGGDWDRIREAISSDPDNGPLYTRPVHKKGRGASGSCFLKDFAAFAAFYEKNIDDKLGAQVFRTLEKKNIDLLVKSGKDVDRLKQIYGKAFKS